MKKVFVVAIILFALVCVAFFAPKASNQDFLRIHIRANSNSQVDQDVKYVVKQAVVDYLTPCLADVHNKSQAMQVVANNLDGIEQTANSVLQSYGFDYVSHAKLCQEQFPDRSYNGIVLPADVYDALIVELGTGKGNNWWCVVYPPLCFVGGESNGTNTIVYKSKLLEIINEWTNK